MSDADSLKAEGLALFQRGLREEAMAKFQAAERAYAQLGDKAGQGEALNNLGVLYRLERKHDAAVTSLRQAAVLFAEVGDKNRQGQAWGNLGDVYLPRDKEAAVQAYTTAVPLLAEAQDPGKQSEVLRALSLLRLRQGKLVEAMFYMADSLRVKPRRGLGDSLLYWLLRFVTGFSGPS